MAVLSVNPAIEKISSNQTGAQWLVGLTAIAIFALMSITLAIVSNGFLEGDACSHYLKARAVFAEPGNLVNVWGRPVYTALFAIPAHFYGRTGVRLTSLTLAIAIALFTGSIATYQRWRWPTLALIFVLAQPLVFLHSFSEMTELPFALLLAIGFWAYQRRQFLLFALLIGLTPLSRPEGFGFVGLAGLALLLHRRWWWIFTLLLPLVAWDYCGWRVYGSHGPWWNWLRANWPWGEESLYDRGTLQHFVMVLPAVVSPFLFPAMVLGIWLCFTNWSNSHKPTPALRYSEKPALLRSIFSADWHLRRCEILIAVIPMLILIGHSVLYWRGKMASNGEIRYMLIVAPFWALLSARGWSWIFSVMTWQRPLLWAGFFAMLPLLVNRAWTVIPMDNTPDWMEAEQIARWYNARGMADRYPNLEVAHVGLRYCLDIDPRSKRLLDWSKAEIDSRPTRTLLVWDHDGALFNSDASRKVPLDEIIRAGWTPLKTRWTDGKGRWQFFLSEPMPRGFSETH